MNIFFSDLDNTIIYSYKHNISDKKTVAEYLGGKEQAYITDYSLNSLKAFCSNKNNLFVPVTTRNIDQYSRIIILQEENLCRQALVCNGAVLLENNRINKEWEEESLRLSEPYYKHMKNIYLYIKDKYGSDHLYFTEPYMIYVIKPENKEIEKYLLSQYGSCGIDTVISSSKLYCIPSVLSKGNAVKRFLLKYENDKENINTIAAGDSVLDISMLKQCGHSFFPDDKLMQSGSLFSDEIFKNIVSII